MFFKILRYIINFAKILYFKNTGGKFDFFLCFVRVIIRFWISVKSPLVCDVLRCAVILIYNQMGPFWSIDKLHIQGNKAVVTQILFL